MKRFKFRLDTLLKIKKQEKDIIKEKLAYQIQKLKEIENDIAYLLRKIDSYSSFYIDSEESGIALWNYSNYKDYLLNLSIQLKEAEGRRTEQSELVKELQVEYLRLKKIVDSLGKMENKELQQYINETQKEEYTAIDELALTKHFRQEDNNG